MTDRQFYKPIKSTETGFLYFDASVRNDTSYGGFYFERIFPPLQENFVFEFGRLSITNAELAAALSGLTRAKEYGICDIHLFGDNSSCINTLNSLFYNKKVKYLEKAENVLEDWWKLQRIKRLIRSFKQFQAYKVDREANWMVDKSIRDTLEGCDKDAIPKWNFDYKY